MSHVRLALVTALVVALLLHPSWPLVAALFVVVAYAALHALIEFVAARDGRLDKQARDAAIRTAEQSDDFDRRISNMETQVRAVTGRGPFGKVG